MGVGNRTARPLREKQGGGFRYTIFTQFADGEVEALRPADFWYRQEFVPNRTRIVLINNGEQAASGEPRFLDATGVLSDIPIGGEAMIPNSICVMVDRKWKIYESR